MRSGVSRCLILFPPNNSYYILIAFAFSRAFWNRGIACAVHTYPTSHEIERALLEQVSPDVVISVNRYKSEAMVERNVTHIVWIVDDYFPPIDFLSPPEHIVSEMTYYCCHSLQEWVPPEEKSMSGVLMFATEIGAKTGVPSDARFDLTMVGGMFDSRTLELEFDLGGARFRGFEFAEFLASEYEGNIDWQPRHIIELSTKFIVKKLGRTGDTPSEGSISARESTIHELIPRLLFRTQCARAMLTTSKVTAIFGSRAWKSWPEFAAHYFGTICTAEEFDIATRASKICVHNGGINVHPRMFDSLGSGGFVMANRIRDEAQDDKIFEPGVHMVEYNLRDFKDVAREFLANDIERARIADEGRRLVAAKHTWDNRVQQVLSDLASM
jgi:hypothetical protein